MQQESLKWGHYYHIYNRGINSCDLFYESDNYVHFLGLYDKYVSPVAETFAWVLMPNHFHLLVRVKMEAEFFSEVKPDPVINIVDSRNLTGFQNLSGLKPPHQHFSNLFNSYSKALNKRIGRHGALFERPFERKLIDNTSYLKQVILYIHNNPVHHRFCSHPLEYPWSSYLSCISVKPTRLKRETVIGWFDNRANFKNMHNQIIDIDRIEKYLKF